LHPKGLYLYCRIKMQLNPLALAILFVLTWVIPLAAQERLADLLADPAIQLSRPVDRMRVVARMEGIENTRRQNARARATRLGLPLRTELPNGRVQEIVDFDGDIPTYFTTYNVSAAISTGANLLRTSPYSLTGSGVTIGLWDGGSARSSHQEFGGRVSVMDGAAIIDHATHVGGTLIASGVDVKARGMAASATINSYDWTSDLSEMTSRGATSAGDPGKIYLSNHSYGYVSGWNYVSGGTPYRKWEWYGAGTTSTSIEADFGLYNNSARDSDSLAFNAPYYLIFRSAGNDNSDNPAAGDAVALSPGSTSLVSYSATSHPAGDGNYRGGFETIGYDAVAKNVITIGSVADAVTNGTRDLSKAILSYFSSCGPTDDGRIKPDVVANGDALYSSFGGSDSAYGTYSGTSMATPNAVGSSALLVQQYGNLFPGQAMRASTLKGLLIHSADDCGNPGPDYKYGWGLVNVQAAADLILDHYASPAKQRITENQLSSAIVTRTQSFVWDGISPIHATLCWTDPAALALSASDSRSSRLINNLNLKIIAPNGSEFFPYVMPFVGSWTQASMGLPATTGINNTDNVEQVSIAAPPVAGAYQAVITFSGTLVNGSQNYSLLVSGSSAAVPAAPTNLVASPGNNTVNLTWSASASATSYQVKRALASGGPYATLASTAATSYSDSPLINGTTYYYVLSASNSSGEGVDSGEISVVPYAAPSTLSLASSPGTAGAYGSTVTLTATVSGGAATGSVIFYDGAVLLGTGTVNVSGLASYATTTLALGSHSVTATYAGDSTLGSSVSESVIYSISPKALAITGVTAGNKVYDASTVATLSGGSLSGVVGAETVTIIAGSGTFDRADVGGHPVIATGYALGGANAGNYLLYAQPLVPAATITPRPVLITGARDYDGTATAGILSIQNNLDGANLSLTGTAKLTGKNVGSQAILTRTLARREQFATGNSGSNMASSFSVAMAITPTSGNTLIAVISTRGSSDNRVSSIIQTGATWTRASQAANSSGTTTEIWFAPNLSGAGTAITISQSSLRSAAVVMEYAGILVTSPLDQVGGASGNSSAPVTGTSAVTTQANELWIGGIGHISSAPTLENLLNNFSSVGSAQSTKNTASSNAKVYALERFATESGAAFSGGTLSSSAQWSGAIVAFKTPMPGSLALTGSAASNYTLVGASGAVQITPRPVMVTAVTDSKIYDGTPISTRVPTLSPALVSGDTATILSQVFYNSNAGAGNKVIVPSLTISDGNGGANYAVVLVNDSTGTIIPASATLALSSLAPVTYDDLPKLVTATTTTPAGLAVSITYDASPNPPTAAGSYAVVATITDPNYQGSTTGTLVIAPANDWVSWSNQHFTEAEQTAGLAAENADPDSDTWPNLAEYALGSDPHQFTPPLVTTLDASGLSLIFSRPANLPNLSYGAESSEDLSNWTPVPLEMLAPGPIETLRARDPLDTGNRFLRFLRLRFTRP
jgi:hypothetical protein